MTSDCLQIPSPSTAREILLSSPDGRLRGLAIALRGRKCGGGYLMTAARAEKAEALYRGGFFAVHVGRTWGFIAPGGLRAVSLSAAMRLSRLTGVDKVTVDGNA